MRKLSRKLAPVPVSLEQVEVPEARERLARAYDLLLKAAVEEGNLEEPVKGPKRASVQGPG